MFAQKKRNLAVWICNLHIYPCRFVLRERHSRWEREIYSRRLGFSNSRLPCREVCFGKIWEANPCRVLLDRYWTRCTRSLVARCQLICFHLGGTLLSLTLEVFFETSHSLHKLTLQAHPAFLFIVNCSPPCGMSIVYYLGSKNILSSVHNITESDPELQERID
jgi:hypothetical protein